MNEVLQTNDTNPAGNSQTPVTSPYQASFDPAQHVPEDLRSEASFQSFKGKTLGDVMKSFVESQKALGGRVAIPGVDAKPEDWEAYYGKLRPGKVEDYKAEWVDPKFGSQLEGPVLDELKKGMYEAGIHPKQFGHIIKVYESALAGHVKTQEQQAALAKSEQIAAIKSKYGPNFEQASILANRAAKRWGGDEFVSAVKDLGLESDPRFFETFYGIGKSTHEDSWHTGNSPSMLSRDGAGAKIDTIMKDPAHPFFHASHPQHVAAVEQMNELRKLKYAKQE